MMKRHGSMNILFDALIRAYFNHGKYNIMDVPFGQTIKKQGRSFFEGKPFEKSQPEPYLIACHPEHQTYFLNIVKEGLERSR